MVACEVFFGSSGNRVGCLILPLSLHEGEGWGEGGTGRAQSPVTPLCVRVDSAVRHLPVESPQCVIVPVYSSRGSV